MSSEGPFTTVVALPGTAGCHVPGEANEKVVECLRELLAEAERGEIIGIGYAGVRPGQGGTTTGWEPGTAPAPMMLAASAGLHARISSAWMDAL